MNIKPILEEFKEYVPNRIDPSVKMPVFFFPLKSSEEKELVETDKRVRFIADSETKKVWVFSSDLLHIDVDSHLGIHKYKGSSFKKPAIFGQATYNNGRFDFLESFNIDTLLSNKVKFKTTLELVANTDWSFFTKYISGFDKELNKVKHEIGRTEPIQKEPSLLGRAEHIRKRAIK